MPNDKTLLLLKPRGFCAGVVRAIDIVRIALETFGRPIYVRKEIVHNRFVVEELQEKGAIFVDSVEEVPAGERVISYNHFSYQEEPGEILTGEGKLTHLAALLSSIFTDRLNSTHLVSRACLGHCFDYMNYEPSTNLFRIHAAPGNPIVMASQADVIDIVDGTYVVKAIDLPLYVLLRCGVRPGDIRVLPLAEGESGKMLACPVMAAAR